MGQKWLDAFGPGMCFYSHDASNVMYFYSRVLPFGRLNADLSWTVHGTSLSHSAAKAYAVILTALQVNQTNLLIPGEESWAFRRLCEASNLYHHSGGAQAVDLHTHLWTRTQAVTARSNPQRRPCGFWQSSPQWGLSWMRVRRPYALSQGERAAQGRRGRHRRHGPGAAPRHFKALTPRHVDSKKATRRIL